MDQNINNRHKEILWDLLANPVENGRSYRETLERLVEDNPQSGLLQVMFARTAETPDVRTPSAYFNPKVLHKILHEPDGLLPVSRERINRSSDGNQTVDPQNYFNIGHVEELETGPSEQIDHEPVAKGESLITQELAQSLNIVPPIEHKKLKAESEDILTPHINVAEIITAEEIETSETIYAQRTPESLTDGETSEPDTSEQSQTFPVEQHSSDYDDDDTFSNPWDLSSLEETPEIELSQSDEPLDAGNNDISTNKIETLAPPEQELEPVKIPKIDNPAAPADILIDTYDHSLSTYEQEAVNEVSEAPIAGEQGEISSFDNYRVENVFHKQDYIEDEVYDEIVSIDEIGVETLGNKFALDSPAEEDIEQPQPTEAKATGQQSFIDEETEKLIYGNIAATDYLSFDKKLDELRNGVKTSAETPEAPVAAPTGVPAETQVTYAPQSAAAAKEPDVISKYNDDSLPYSFMWWLDKTRKEHANANQPYAEPVKTPAVTENPYRPEFNPSAEKRFEKNNPDELQQQYYANIFSLTSISSIGDVEPPQIAFDHNKKEDIIIERFIHTDPHIKPLSADKLDNENKAKKSSEDQNILVTETLARIYGDQMLYHKAIATYKKLMLKIPEKKLYFAAQIEQLEKKIN